MDGRVLEQSGGRPYFLQCEASLTPLPFLGVSSLKLAALTGGLFFGRWQENTGEAALRDQIFHNQIRRLFGRELGCIDAQFRRDRRLIRAVNAGEVL